MAEAQATDLLPAPTADSVVHAVGIPNPFTQQRRHVEIRPGATLSEILVELGLKPHGPYSVEVWIDGSKVAEPFLDRTKPKPGTTVVARLVPHGGNTGKAIFSIIIGIGLALFTAGAGLAGAALGLAPTAGQLIFGAALSGAFLYSGVNSLVNPPPGVPFAGDIPTSKQSPALLQEGNDPRRYAPVRRQYGRYLVFPDYAAKPYTEIAGEESYLRALFDLGYGPLDVTDLKIGDTPIASFDAEYVIHPGYDDDPDLTLYTNSVDESAVGTGLDDGDIVERTTETDTHSISLDLTFPGGLIGFTQQLGVPHPVAVAFAIQYRESTGPGAWTDAVFKTPYAPGMVSVAAGSFAFNGMETGLWSRGVSFDVPAPGIYDVKVERVSTVLLPNPGYADDPNPLSTIDDCIWTVLRSIRPATKPRVPNLCMIEMRLRLSDQIQGQLRDLNCIAERILPVWSAIEPLGDGWGPSNLLSTNTSLQATRNPAWAFAEELRGRHNRLRVQNSKVDIASIAAWASKCDTEGRTFDAVVDFDSTIGQVAQDIAASGRAALTRIDGRYGVVVDEVKPTIITHLSPRDSYGFSSSRAFRHPVHAVRVGFVNAAKGYQPDEVIVYDDGYDESTATEFDRIDLWGVSDSDRAWRDGRYHIAATKLRPEVYSVNVDIHNLRLTRGDRFRFTHDVMLVGVLSGRIKEVNYSGTDLVYVVLDEVLDLELGKEYGAVFRCASGEELVAKIVTPGSPTNAVVLYPAGTGVDTSSLTTPPGVQDLVTIGEFGQETGDYLVHAVYPAPNLGARIEFVDYNEAIYNADTETIPPYDPGVTLTNPRPLQVPALPSIDVVLTDESALVIAKDGTITPAILLGVKAGPGGDVPTRQFQAQYRVNSPQGIWRTVPAVDVAASNILITGVSEDVVYDVRVRAIGPTNTASAWRTSTSHLVVGSTTPPPDVTELLRGPDKRLVWQYPNPPRDHAGFLIKHQAGSDANWLTGIPAHDGLVTETQFDGTLIPGGTRTIMVKAIDLGGNESLNAAVLIADLGGPALENVVESYDIHAGGFTGTKTNCTVEGITGDLVADTEAVLFWRADSSTFWKTPDSTPFWDQGWQACDYVDSWTPASTSLPGRLEASITVTAPSWRLEYRVSGSSVWLPWPGFVQVDTVTTYEFRVVIDASAIEPRVTAFSVFIDVPDVVEYQNDIVVAAAGVFRLTLTQTFKAIKQIQATVQDTGSGARKLVVLDKQALPGAGNGPSVQLWDDANPPVRVSDQVDFILRGY